MKTSENINDIAKAMSSAQKEMKPAAKDSLNPHFKSKYADVSSVWESIREPITNHGLTIWQDVTTEERQVSITTRIVHVSGQWVEFGPLSVPLSRGDAHGVGSAITYGKRYALCAAVGVVAGDEDDDGNASKHQSQQQVQPVPPVKLSEGKIIELNELFKQTGSEFYQSLMDKIKSAFPAIKNLSDFNEQIYSRTKTLALDEIERLKKEKSNESSD